MGWSCGGQSGSFCSGTPSAPFRPSGQEGSAGWPLLKGTGSGSAPHAQKPRSSQSAGEASLGVAGDVPCPGEAQGLVGRPNTRTTSNKPRWYIPGRKSVSGLLDLKRWWDQGKGERGDRPVRGSMRAGARGSGQRSGESLPCLGVSTSTRLFSSSCSLAAIF